MTYSVDLRERVVSYVENGGLKSEAARVFNVGRRTVHRWLAADDLQPRPAQQRHRKLDKAALAAHVRDHDDMLLRERAAHFGVHVNAIWVALRQMDIRKKNDEIFAER
jgi:transposase